MVDPRLFTDEDYRKAVERCVECPYCEDCEPFQYMLKGGPVIRHCPRGRANVI
jgi:hypothetical protein